MWADNETTDDLLGFRVHSDLIQSVVTDPSLLPVVLGVFGDWGSGKSSIMKMLQVGINTEAQNDIACLYFNGWVFEGYEDAKTALLTSILLALGEHKRLGPKVREKVVGLLKRVQWMEVGRLALKHVGVPLATAALTGGVSAIPAAATTLLSAVQSKRVTEKAPDGQTAKGDTWLSQVLANPTEPELLEVRRFREEFESLLAETNLRAVVVLIDDLDRCLPPRIIETLEAIKLFVAVPGTAFVVGADPRIVEHAISTQYARHGTGEPESGTEEYDLVKDYLEKLIQIPYYLPRLSPAEIETYVNLLLCAKHLPAEEMAAVKDLWQSKRQDDSYTAFSLGDVGSALGGKTIPPELEGQLAWSSAVALSITEGLKGNPRQVKRMLNAMLLRSKLAEIAKIDIRSDVLAKLMVLEYSQPARFRELDTWQTTDRGLPAQLQQLEADVQTAQSVQPNDTLAAWRHPRLQHWLQMEPQLTGVDLRDYFWVARDRTRSTLSAASLVSPLVRRLFGQLISPNRGEVTAGLAKVPTLSEPERDEVLSLLERQLARHPDQLESAEALRNLAENGIDAAARALFAAIAKGARATMAPAIPNKLALLARAVPAHRAEIVKILDDLAEGSASPVSTAAKVARREIR